MNPFDELGRMVEQEWRVANYAEARFPEIARRCLEKLGLPERIDPWDVPAWTVRQNVLPEQRDLPGRFGDFPVTMFNSPRFHVDVYFWLDGTTAIHQHSFCGAFQVVSGSSLHSRYAFHEQERVNTYVAVGDVAITDVELLRRGDVREIPPGRGFIHALFHLDRPSVSVVVRTHLSALDAPQFSYHKPWLALDPFFGEANLTKKLQAFSIMLRAARTDAADELAQSLASADFHSTFLILRHLRPLLGGNALERLVGIEVTEPPFDRLLAVAESRHGTLAAPFRALFARQDAEHEIVRRRALVSDPDVRFFLALVLNLDTREQILTALHQRFDVPDPLSKAVDMVSELAETRVAGSKETVLGIDGFGELDALVLEDVLRGVPLDSIEANLTSNGTALGEPVSARVDRLRGSAILAPLFR